MNLSIMRLINIWRKNKMTKTENKKCEKLMYEAIRKANKSIECYNNYKSLSTRDGWTAEIELRKANQDCGYAKGINKVLTFLGFKHKDMKTLEELCNN